MKGTWPAPPHCHLAAQCHGRVPLVRMAIHTMQKTIAPVSLTRMMVATRTFPCASHLLGLFFHTQLLACFNRCASHAWSLSGYHTSQPLCLAHSCWLVFIVLLHMHDMVIERLQQQLFMVPLLLPAYLFLIAPCFTRRWHSSRPLSKRLLAQLLVRTWRLRWVPGAMLWCRASCSDALMG